MYSSIQRYIPTGAGWVVAVDDNVEAVDEIFAVDKTVLVVLVVDEVAVEETVEEYAVVKVAVDEVVDDEVSAVDGSFDAAAEKKS